MALNHQTAKIKETKMQNTTFDATQFTPQQGGQGHPVGIFDFQITNTYAKSTKDQSGGMFIVELTSPAGKIENRYNLWNSSTQAVEIAQKALSALCYAVGIFRINFPNMPDGSPDLQNAGKELRGGRGKMEIGYQIDRESKQSTAYVEVKKILDIQGNEPGKAPTQQSAPQPQQQPQQNGGWNNQPQQNTNPQPAQSGNQGGWQPGPNQNPAPANNTGGGWSQGAAPSQAPPWGNR